MANEEQLSILKQGVEVWNKWREENPNAEIDLSEVDLFATYLRGGVNFSSANLRRAFLARTELNLADLSGADLSGAKLGEANLHGANLSRAKFIGADLNSVDLTIADLTGADLTGANLFAADLRLAQLDKTKFSSAVIAHTNFGNVVLTEALGLDEIIHKAPSTLGTNTLAYSNGKIPEIFLQGCGLSNWEIEETKLYNPDLSNEEINKILYRMYDLRATQALQISPLFISYSHADGTFVDKLESSLNEKGIRFWRDIHDMKAGRIEAQIDRAISQNRTVLLVLSENSIKSDWVEHEVRTARGLEKNIGRDVLCPVALDDSWKSSPWPKRVMEQIMEYNILDFSEWKDDVKFEGMFRKLIDGLQLFYKG
jgi:hypothetical protein